jgi:hypothetical protein
MFLIEIVLHWLRYGLTDKLRLQLGFMNQSTETAGKDQIQFSLHHTF